MKSVMFSEIVRTHRSGSRLRSLSPLTAYGLTVALGMPCLVLALRALDPGAPLAAIVLPVLAGLALPLWVAMPGKLEVHTRFDAIYMRPTLDEVLLALGYAESGTREGQLRYVSKNGSWRAGGRVVGVRIRPHALDIVGPIPTLRALQQALSGAAGAAAAPAPRRDLPSRETVAGAIQISDNAERVAGMAE